MKKSKLGYKTLLVMTFLTFVTSSFAAEKIHPDVKALIALNIEPEGVVFDVETLDEHALTKLAEYIKRQVAEVKKAFPEVDIAVVSHGVEEYALQTANQEKQSNLHNVFSGLVKNQDVSVHVCGAVAGLKNLSQEDFPDYVSYSASGMAQINDYKALGYQIIVIKQLNDQQRKDLFKKPQNYIGE